MTDLLPTTDLKPNLEGGANNPTVALSPPAPVPAEAAAAASRAPAAGLTAVLRMLACVEPGCSGTILDDDYCDVCGSPASAPAAASARAAAAIPTKPAQRGADQTAVPNQPAQQGADQTAVPTKPSPASAQAASTSEPSVPVKVAQAALPSWPSPAAAEPAATPVKRRRVLPSPAAAEPAATPAKRRRVLPSPSAAEPAATPVKRRRVLPIVLASVASTLVAVLAVAAFSIYRVDRSLTQNLDREDLMPTDLRGAPRPAKGKRVAD